METENAPQAQGPVSKLSGSAKTASSKEPAVVAPEPAQGSSEAEEKAESQPKARTSEKSRAPAPEAKGDADAGSFIDPNDLPPELQPHYKRMQAAFTKKTQEVAAQKQKITAFDQFAANPMAAIQQLATQYGFKVVPPNAPPGVPEQDWTPQTWMEVRKTIKEEAVEDAKRAILGELTPVISNVQQITARNIEQQFDQIDPNWRDYEDQLKKNVQLHPTLVKDPNLLYRISVPEEIIEARLTKKALARVESKKEASKVTGKTGISRSAPPRPERLSFAQSVEWAKQHLNRSGG